MVVQGDELSTSFLDGERLFEPFCTAGVRTQTVRRSVSALAATRPNQLPDRARWKAASVTPAAAAISGIAANARTRRVRGLNDTTT